MLALRLEFLTGRYVATAYDDRSASEWPPHPARVFSALVAAHHAAEVPDAGERAALEWLEALPAPSLCGSAASQRDVVPVFVPVNDAAVSANLDLDFDAWRQAEARLEALRVNGRQATGAAHAAAQRDLKKAERAVEKQRAAFERAAAAAVQPGPASDAMALAALQVLPERRGRQPRTFPAVTPDEPVVHVVWPEAQPSRAQRDALDALAARVTRLGHSSSLVACRFVDEAPDTGWAPDDDGRQVLRVTRSGQLQQLEEEFVRHHEEQPRVLPCTLQRYRGPDERPPREAPASVLGSDWIVFERVGGAALPPRRTPDVTNALRGTLLRHLQGRSDLLTGHTAERGPADRPHVAFLALPFVGYPHADGVILGAALVLPRDLPAHERDALFGAVAACEREARQEQGTPEDEPARLKLFMGRAGELELCRVHGLAERRTLNPDAWCGLGERWASVTPIALDRNPGNLYARDAREAADATQAAEEIVATACEHVGLPRPAVVCVAPVSLVRAAEPVRAYGPFPSQPGRLRRVLVHAEVVFDQPVRGPVILGAGRYYGLGLCRAVHVDGGRA